MISRAPLLIFALSSIACAPPALVTSSGPAPRPESDAPALVRVTQHAGATAHDLGLHRAALSWPDGRALVVTEERALVVVDGDARRTLLDSVVGLPARLDDARVVAARATGPGASDLWIVDVDARERPRAIAAHAGADGQPFVLEDGRVLFVSDRSGVASVFVLSPDADAHEVTQLTNRAERPGALTPAFVPPPVQWLSQQGARVRYDAGDATVVLDVVTGRAEVL